MIESTPFVTAEP